MESVSVDCRVAEPTPSPQADGSPSPEGSSRPTQADESHLENGVALAVSTDTQFPFVSDASDPPPFRVTSPSFSADEQCLSWRGKWKLPMASGRFIHFSVFRPRTKNTMTLTKRISIGGSHFLVGLGEVHLIARPALVAIGIRLLNPPIESTKILLVPRPFSELTFLLRNGVHLCS